MTGRVRCTDQTGKAQILPTPDPHELVLVFTSGPLSPNSSPKCFWCRSVSHVKMIMVSQFLQHSPDPCRNGISAFPPPYVSSYKPATGLAMTLSRGRNLTQRGSGQALELQAPKRQYFILIVSIPVVLAQQRSYIISAQVVLVDLLLGLFLT